MLYPKIAKKYDVTPQRVERAIRHVVESSWNKGNIDLRDAMFSYSVSMEKGKPTNSHFVTTLTEYIKVYLPEWRAGTWKF